MIQAILANLGLVRYATDREMLQANLYAIHPHSRRLDRLHRIQTSIDNAIQWPKTEAFLRNLTDTKTDV